MREDIEGGNCSSWPTMAAGGFSGARVSHSSAQKGRLPDVAREVELVICVKVRIIGHREFCTQEGYDGYRVFRDKTLGRLQGGITR